MNTKIRLQKNYVVRATKPLARLMRRANMRDIRARGSVRRLQV